MTFTSIYFGDYKEEWLKHCNRAQSCKYHQAVVAIAIIVNNIICTCLSGTWNYYIFA